MLEEYDYGTWGCGTQESVHSAPHINLKEENILARYRYTGRCTALTTGHRLPCFACKQPCVQTCSVHTQHTRLTNQRNMHLHLQRLRASGLCKCRRTASLTLLFPGTSIITQCSASHTLATTLRPTHAAPTAPIPREHYTRSHTAITLSTIPAYPPQTLQNPPEPASCHHQFSAFDTPCPMCSRLTPHTPASSSSHINLAKHKAVVLLTCPAAWSAPPSPSPSTACAPPAAWALTPAR